ncbi:hypothetical protein B0H14DRAFT_3741652 [Mycena olivaceomarginata]|nr:hypothetical protein B0H14DRAFT_3741652 [Mycena olivaceomarginata]
MTANASACRSKDTTRTVKPCQPWLNLFHTQRKAYEQPIILLRKREHAQECGRMLMGRPMSRRRSPAGAEPSLPWNESQLDLVRLPSLPSDPMPKNSRGSKGTSRVSGSLPGSQKSSRDASAGPDESASSSLQMAPGSDNAPWSEHSQSFMSNGASGSGSESQSASGSEGFSVLIAIDELEDALVVRQVSENAEELLGLPTRYLFSLECLTDTLPQSQAGTLGDNIQFLSEFDQNTQEEEASPHVFLLTGWGAPGSAAPGDPNASNGRCSWTCWCAVHRPLDPTGMSNPGLIIMEFELERDTLADGETHVEAEVAGWRGLIQCLRRSASERPKAHADQSGASGMKLEMYTEHFSVLEVIREEEFSPLW